VQPGIPQALIWDPNANTNRFRQLLELSERALTNQTELLIWPEAAVPEFDEISYAAITNFVRTHHLWLICNADDASWRPNAKNKDDFDVFNAAFLFNPEGRCAAVYHKQKLVIFGEYIPLVRWLPFIKWFTPITGSFASGDRVVPFEMDWWGECPSGRSQTKTDPREPFGDTNVISIGGLPGISPHQKVTTSTLICFEDVFPE